MNATPQSQVNQKLVLLKFLVVGGLGTITHLTIFFVLVDLRGWIPEIGHTVGFIAAVGQNYLLNHYWTFSHRVQGTHVSAGRYLRFLLVALAALTVNLFFLRLVLIVFDPPWKVIASAAGILAGTVVNYFGARLWVFTKHD